MKPYKTYTLSEATTIAMKFCAYRERCHKEVEEKLRQLRMIPEARQQILYRLIQEDFLNEERFARSFARGKFRIKKWGKERILRELKLRNISAFNCKLAMEEIPENDYQKTFTELAEKKLTSINEKHPLKIKQKLAGYLKYKGFESAMIYDYLNTLQL